MTRALPTVRGRIWMGLVLPSRDASGLGITLLFNAVRGSRSAWGVCEAQGVLCLFAGATAELGQASSSLVHGVLACCPIVDVCTVTRSP